MLISRLIEGAGMCLLRTMTKLEMNNGSWLMAVSSVAYRVGNWPFCVAFSVENGTGHSKISLRMGTVKPCHSPKTNWNRMAVFHIGCL